MAFSDYAGLKAAVADYLNRTDLTAQIPDFIGLAEVWMMRKLRLRLLEADATISLAGGARTSSLPTDYREPLNLWWNSDVDRRPLRFVPAGLLTVLTTEARPEQWTVDGTNIAFERPADQAYTFTLRYRQSFTLSDDVTTNVVLTQYPDLYLAACLAEAAPFLKDDEASQRWIDRRGHIEHDIREEEARQKAPATLSTDLSRLSRRNGRSFNIYSGF